jgi:RNA polymerase sigma-70 factor (ECF subfamily)
MMAGKDRWRLPAQEARRSMADGTDRERENDRARRFRDIALPHLDGVYTLARYLAGNAADAEDAVQDCYLRALRHFDTFRGPDIRPWLFTILRNVCHAAHARRAPEQLADEHDEQSRSVWQEDAGTPETQALRQHDDATIRRLVGELPPPFREVIVMREIDELSYRDSATVTGTPVGTVMSRLARGRALLRAAWNAANAAEDPNDLR